MKTLSAVCLRSSLGFSPGVGNDIKQCRTAWHRKAWPSWVQFGLEKSPRDCLQKVNSVSKRWEWLRIYYCTDINILNLWLFDTHRVEKRWNPFFCQFFFISSLLCPCNSVFVPPGVNVHRRTNSPATLCTIHKNEHHGAHFCGVRTRVFVPPAKMYTIQIDWLSLTALSSSAAREQLHMLRWSSVFIFFLCKSLTSYSVQVRWCAVRRRRRGWLQ